MSLVRMDTTLRASLENLLGRLPIRDDRRHLIAMEAEGLYFAAGMGSVNDLPRAKRTGANIARRELAKLAKLTYALGKHIKNMHRDALEAIEAHKGNGRHPLDLKDELLELLRAIGRAENTIPETPATHKHSLHTKHQAGDVTKHAASVYEQLTGRQIKRNSKTVNINAHQSATKEDGEFHQFLTEVFKLLRIDAKASGQIKLLLAEKGRQKKAS